MPSLQSGVLMQIIPLAQSASAEQVNAPQRWGFPNCRQTHAPAIVLPVKQDPTLATHGGSVWQGS
jgi:hypothetical protein